MKNYIILVLITLLVTSCFKENSNDVNQDRVYGEYEVFFNANDSTTTVSAKFRLGGPEGNPIELEYSNNGGAYVTFNNDTLEYDYWKSAHVKEYQGLINSGNFVYVNNDGDAFTNPLPLLGQIDFPAGFDTLYKNVTDTFYWSGLPIGGGHSIKLEIDSWFWGSDAEFVADTMGQSYMIMEPSELSDLNEGDGNAKLYKTVESSVVQGTSEGGVIRNKFRALDRDVKILN